MQNPLQDVDVEELLAPARKNLGGARRIMLLERRERLTRAVLIGSGIAFILCQATMRTTIPALVLAIAALVAWLAVAYHLYRTRAAHRATVCRATSHIRYVPEDEQEK